MTPSFDPGALLARSYALSGGARVCLRLARVRDLDGIEALFEREGRGVTRLELVRLLRSHPRSRIVLCATALIGFAETVVGLAAIDLESDPRQPELLITDGERADGLEQLLSEALIGRAQALAAARAA